MRKSDLFAAAMHEALTSGALVRFRAEGTSMYPTIRDGEVVTIAPVVASEVVRGDVLMCRHSEQFLTHRVVAVAGRDGDRVFHLRGDAKAGCDAPVAAVNVVGRVISVGRNGRTIPICGRSARLRYRARATASRARTFVGLNSHRRSRLVGARRAKVKRFQNLWWCPVVAGLFGFWDWLVLVCLPAGLFGF